MNNARIVGNHRVITRIRVDDRHRDKRVGVDVLPHERWQIDVGQRVAVDDEEPVRFQQRDGARRSARRSQDFRFPRIPH
jgi:hypothetical protein